MIISFAIFGGSWRSRFNDSCISEAVKVFIVTVFKFSSSLHISPVLIELHWLPVKYRIIFKIILLTYKSLNGCAPSYISELISLKQKGRYNLRSCSECLLTVPNDIMKKTMGERAFAAAAPSVWNKLPIFLRNQPMSLNSFKKSLKTYLFKLAF